MGYPEGPIVPAISAGSGESGRSGGKNGCFKGLVGGELT